VLVLLRKVEQLRGCSRRSRVVLRGTREDARETRYMRSNSPACQERSNEERFGFCYIGSLPLVLSPMQYTSPSPPASVPHACSRPIEYVANGFGT
jgi:hypothetical protein